MSAQEGILAHYGAGLGNVNADEQLLFFLMAEVKGKISPHPDHDTLSQGTLRAREQHAFAAYADDCDVAREWPNV